MSGCSSVWIRGHLFEKFRGEDLSEMFLLYDSINKYTLLYLWCEIVYNKAKRILNGRIIYSDMHTQISLLRTVKS